MGIQWHTWISLEMIIEVEEHQDIQYVLEELAKYDVSLIQKLQEYHTEMDKKRRNEIFIRLSPIRQALALYAQGKYEDALKLYFDVMEEINANPNIDIFLR